MMKVICLIVTYGDRFHLVKQVVEACFREGVSKVIVVDNQSEPRSRGALRNLEKEMGNLRVVFLPDNTGSAGGYNIGLHEAQREDDCDFIWLLDDDNRPSKGSLQKLKEFWINVDLEEKDSKLCLLSYREVAPEFREAVYKGDPTLVLGRENSFLGFHFANVPRKLLAMLKVESNGRFFLQRRNFGEVAVAPFGGMFFNIELVKEIGYPREDFFLYFDDHEFSHRVVKHGGKIIVVLNSIVEDISKPWWQKQTERNSDGVSRLLKHGDDVQVYYSVRNRVFFERENLVTNKVLYFVNRHLCLGALVLFSLLSRRKDRMKLIKLAVSDAFKGRLGKKAFLSVGIEKSRVGS